MHKKLYQQNSEQKLESKRSLMSIVQQKPKNEFQPNKILLFENNEPLYTYTNQ